jgi:hypothetical protein
MEGLMQQALAFLHYAVNRIRLVLYRKNLQSYSFLVD